MAIGTSPPSWIARTNAAPPTDNAPNGSIRTDSTAATIAAALFVRVLGAWVPLSSAVIGALAGDVTGPSAANIVESLTGTGGDVTVFATRLSWNRLVAAPIIRQNTLVIGDGVASGQTLTIQAQNAVNASAIGGHLQLSSGSSNVASVPGEVRLQAGGVTKLTVYSAASATTTVAIEDSHITMGPAGIGGPTIAAGAGAPATTPGDGALFMRTNGTADTTLYVRSGGAWSALIGTVTLAGDVTGATGSNVVSTITGSAGVVSLVAATLRWAVATATPKLHQADNITNSATAQTLTVQAANATGTAATGGALHLTSGTGTTIAGAVELQTGGTARLIVSTTAVTVPSGTSLTINASGPTVTAGAGAPASTPGDGSVFFRTDGTASTTLYVRAASAWSALVTTAGAMGGDVTGTIAANTVVTLTGTGNLVTMPATTNLAFTATNPAGIGRLRFETTSTILAARNAGNSADLAILATDASDFLYIGTTAAGASKTVLTILDASNSVALRYAGSTKLQVTSTGVIVSYPIKIDLGGTVATVGDIRVPNNTTILAARNAGNTADLAIIYTDASDNARFGVDSSNHVRVFNGGVNLVAGGSTSIATASGSVQFVTILQWHRDSGSAATILQTVAQSADVATSNISITPQAAYASATGTNRTSGSLLIKLAAPTNSGTVEARFTVQRAGASHFHVSGYDGAPTTYTGIWAGPSISPTSSNFLFLSDGASVSYFNVPSGGTIQLSIAGSSGTDGSLSITAASGILWAAASTAPGIRQTIQAGDVAANNLTVRAQSASAAATGANENGGFVHVQGGALDGAGNMGGVRLQLNASTSENMVEITHLAAARKIVSLVRSSALTTTEMPTNTGSLVIYIGNAATAPTASPVSGGILYSEAGAGKWYGTSGTVTTFGPAEPHCPACGRDYVFEARNDSRDEHLAICWPCFTDEAEKKGLDVSAFAFHRKLKKAA